MVTRADPSPRPWAAMRCPLTTIFDARFRHSVPRHECAATRLSIDRNQRDEPARRALLCDRQCRRADFVDFNPSSGSRTAARTFGVSCGEPATALGAPVLARAPSAAAEQLSELVGIDLIALVPLPRCPAPIADGHPIDERRQVVGVLRPGTFLQ